MKYFYIHRDGENCKLNLLAPLKEYILDEKFDLL